jgi:hypothetical protein
MLGSALNIISLGAGVQSSTMAIMAAHGEITPMPDCAIFADTQWEPPAVYKWLCWLTQQLPFPVYRETAGDLRQDVLDRSNTIGGRFAAIPWFMKMPDGKDAMGRRQCTKDYKVRPIQRKIVDLLGGHPKGGCQLWIGISIDEASRMKPSRVKYIEHRWPLIEQSMNRNDCLQWMARHDYPAPPRSSCIGCPFHNDNEWRAIKADPEMWADVVEVDNAIRTQSGFKGKQFVHRKMMPIADVDFATDEDRGQLNMFENECEGMCGV